MEPVMAMPIVPPNSSFAESSGIGDEPDIKNASRAFGYPTSALTEPVGEGTHRLTAIVTKVEERDGKYGKFKRYTLEGKQMAAFKANLIQAMDSAVAHNREVNIVYESKQNGQWLSHTIIEVDGIKAPERKPFTGGGGGRSFMTDAQAAGLITATMLGQSFSEEGFQRMYDFVKSVIKE